MTDRKQFDFTTSDDLRTKDRIAEDIFRRAAAAIIVSREFSATDANYDWLATKARDAADYWVRSRKTWLAEELQKYA